MRALFALLLAGAASSCVVEPLDLEGRQCPCAEGWTCDAARDVCVRVIAPDASFDGGMDAGRADAGDAGREMDSGIDGATPRDAGPDAGIDAGIVDVDGGFDAGMQSDDAGGLDSTSCDDVNAGRVFCDGFETNMTYPEWDGVTVDGAGATAWNMTNTYRGRGAFEARTTAAGADAYIGKDAVGPYTSGELWLRGYFYISSVPALDHVSIMYTGNDGNDGVGVEILTGGSLVLYLLTADVDVSAGVLPLDEWVCIELGVTIGTAGSATVRVNESVRATYNANTSSVGYRTFTVGLDWTDVTNEAATVLVDEIVFDTSGPIGCD